LSLRYFNNISPAAWSPYPKALPPVQPPTHNQEQHEPSTSPIAPVLTDLQTQLYDTQASLTNHVDKVRALEGVFSEHDVIKREIGMLWQLMKKSSSSPGHEVRGRDTMRRERDEEDDFGVGRADDHDDDTRSIRPIVPRELGGGRQSG
jgi:hypothetical protein